MSGDISYFAKLAVVTAIEFTTPVWVALLAAVLLASVLGKLREPALYVMGSRDVGPETVSSMRQFLRRRGTTEPATRGALRLAS